MNPSTADKFFHLVDEYRYLALPAGRGATSAPTALRTSNGPRTLFNPASAS
jgi:hypothetical protein